MKIIHVSYRLPISIQKTTAGHEVNYSSGGLVTALKAVAATHDSDMTWVGVADFTAADWAAAQKDVTAAFDLAPVFLPKQVEKDFYHGFSNSVLWPLFHYFPSYVEYKEEYFEAYVKANEVIAEKVLQHYAPGDVIWIHDYHLCPLASIIRLKQPKAKIGFFLHIPFPQFELFRILPERVKKHLLHSLLDADLLGFHTWDYAIAFAECVEKTLGLSHRNFTFYSQTHRCKVGAFPISVDYERFNSHYDKEDVQEARNFIKTAYAERKIIFSVDRLDYTKGVMYRLNAYARFLKKYPEWKERVVFILVIVPSRDMISKYSERKQMIELNISKINGKYGSFRWTPVVYQYQSLDFTNLLGLYTSADIAFISPIRDGMNLVAKEFVASRKDKQGVLMLSEFTGAANELQSALLFNPLDSEQVVKQLHRSLLMPEAEQEQRLETMQAYLKEHTVFHWAENFLASLNEAHLQNKPVDFFGYEQKQELLYTYTNAKKRLILLDYDGTLVDFHERPELAVPSQELKDKLQDLTANPRNTVAIISGRDMATLEEWFGALPLSLIAEHGALVKQQEEWVEQVALTTNWQQRILEVMREYTEIYSSSFIELKKYSVAWHYRNVNTAKGFVASRSLLATLKHYLADDKLSVIDGNNVIEVKPASIDKGNAYRNLYAKQDFDCVVAIGDDRTDEDLFAALINENQYSIKVGAGPTRASYHLDTVQQVLSFLPQLQ